MAANQTPATEALIVRCTAIVERLGRLYRWRFEGAAATDLAGAVTIAHAGAYEPTERSLELACCRLHFAALFHALAAGGEGAEQTLAELFSVRWPEAGSETAVHYDGYLFRAALVTLRRRLTGSNVPQAEWEELAADAAGRALTTVNTRFRDCRDPDAFWGWTSRVVERAAIDELRSGKATGGTSIRAASLDETADQDPAGDTQERLVEAIAVREELVRKCQLGKLSIDQREALVRSFWGGEKPQEVAAALAAERGVPVSAAQISLWKHRGLQVMETNLRGSGYE
jgi:DNA-directed RNA polymerase specialized sigma24 family protein